MITPNDIATKDFKKVAVGYSPEEVDTFLDDIYEDYEKLYKESQKEKSKTEAVAEDTDRLKHLEKSIERTLSLAEAAAEETKAAAKADGDAIINSAKQQAEDIDEDEAASAVLAAHPREFPYVSAADGAACRQQDEAQPGTQSFSFHLILSFHFVVLNSESFKLLP